MVNVKVKEIIDNAESVLNTILNNIDNATKNKSEITTDLKSKISTLQERINFLKNNVDKNDYSLNSINSFLNEVKGITNIEDLYLRIKLFEHNNFKYYYPVSKYSVFSSIKKSTDEIITPIINNAQDIINNTEMNIDNLKTVELANNVLKVSNRINDKLSSIRKSIEFLMTSTSKSTDEKILNVKELEILKKSLRAYEFYLNEINDPTITKSLFKKLKTLSEVPPESYEYVLFTSEYFENELTKAKIKGNISGILTGLFTMPIVFVICMFFCPILMFLMLFSLLLLIPISGAIAFFTTKSIRDSSIENAKDNLEISRYLMSPQEQYLESGDISSVSSLVTFSVASAKYMYPKDISKGWIHTDKQAEMS